LRGVLELAAIDVEPSDPIAAGEDGAAGFEGVGGAEFIVCQWANRSVGIQAKLPGVAR
jgi:hypothetical protein